eukprot:CAMPEP_0170535182 /NCGR_PEP_ID=MMETSP0209-20121228/98151_1 /TAXON_ID=665100 ORGANISM="Litonotus pictus, Strain P1" /NCGR_SAMPLE_ID=MMETSP0209 /ASSEMBLY_ACC=CAM_ASM_000301 /LENGTH=38 /DNA_ID= /DNA_START= /DNA_END= /DNA_ORIENTATION=
MSGDVQAVYHDILKSSYDKVEGIINKIKESGHEGDLSV